MNPKPQTNALPPRDIPLQRSIQLLEVKRVAPCERFDDFVGNCGMFELGRTTDTQDLEGVVVRTAPYEGILRADVERVMREVASRGMQTPPIFSALKRGGKAMHRIARQLRTAPAAQQATLPVLEPRTAIVHEVRLESFSAPHAEFFLRVAKGFYVRTFCHDVGESLGCGAVLTQLVRTRIGPHSLEDACGPEDFGKDHEGLQRFFRRAA